MKIGDTFYKKRDDRKYHIVNIFIDKDVELIVYKFFGKHKRWWHYEIEEYETFEDCLKAGLYYTKKDGIK